MDQTNSTNLQGKSKLEKAEDAASKSVERFESAMEHLADKVEDSSRRVEHTVELANKSKDDLIRMKNTAISAFDPVKPYVRRASDFSSQTYSRARENPRPFLMAAIGFIGGLLLLSYYRNRREARSRTDTYRGPSYAY